MTTHPSQWGHERRKECHPGQPLPLPTSRNFIKVALGKLQWPWRGGTQGHRPRGWEPGLRSPAGRLVKAGPPSPMAATVGEKALKVRW